jgi:DNA (cytosine-5)-methyltransferase 1
MTMRLLDLFCGAGGCSVGYHRAGFDVIGVDIEWHPSYPYRMIVADVFNILDPPFLDQFDAIHASPPCQRYTSLRHRARREYQEMITPTRDTLDAWGGPYVIENVVGAPLNDPVLLCGSMFNLWAECVDGTIRQLRRHRLFESNITITPPRPCDHQGQPAGVYGYGGGGQQLRGYKAVGDDARNLLGIPWANINDLAQAIPPAYTEHIGHQLRQTISTNRTGPIPTPQFGWEQPDLIGEHTPAGEPATPEEGTP